MKIQSAEFVVSAVHNKDFPSERLPEIAFVGRSNVGKSSLINKLLNRKRLVKVSSTPGRTQTVNFFRINQSFYFVDLPGYGYAKVPREVKRHFGPMIERYLENNHSLACVVHILDARHRPTELDRMMREYLLYYGIRILTAATKSDKLPMGKRRKRIQEIRKMLDMSEDTPLILFSTISSEGKKETWQMLQSAMQE